MTDPADCQLHCGDCLEILPTLPAACVDMVLCDLPYGTTACKWDSVIPFEPLWREYRRVTKPNAAIVLTASQPFTTALVGSNIGRGSTGVACRNTGRKFIGIEREPSYFAIAQQRIESQQQLVMV